MKHEIFNIEADVELGLICGNGVRRGVIGEYTEKEAGFMW